MKKTSLSRALLLFGLLSLLGCGHEPSITELSPLSDPQTEMNRVGADLQEARVQQVDVLAPRSFHSAEKYRESAIKARAENKSQKEVLHLLALCEGSLKEANGFAQTARQVLKEPVDARQLALKAKAADIFPKELEASDRHLKDVTERIEDHDTSISQEQSRQLTTEYRDLEIKTIQQDKLGESQKTLKEALKEGAKKLTPETLLWAQTTLTRDEQAIAKDPENSALVDRVGAEAKYASERLLKLVRDAKGSTARNPEQLALQVEKNQTAASKASQDLAEAQGDLAGSQQQLAATSATNDQLRSKVLLDQEFETARAQFTPQEADVYRQGDRLVLRLKGLSFSSDRAGLKVTNYALLAKVQKVIGDLGASRVAVEGHTDSVGAKALNQDLSEKRAKAVQSYLVANKTVDADKITAAGFGDAKPISSNKTAAGRAQNRRVDIVIQAETAVQ